MLIKSADDKQPQLETLASLLARSDLGAETRRRIDQEVRSVRSGIAGERDAAYQIDFYFGPSPNWMVIHDLRLEIDGRVAQIDHLLLGRTFDVWVCESKHFAQGVGVNEHGEWTAYYEREARGIPSPVEQNRRHTAVLQDVFRSRLVWMPSRLGIRVRPSIESLVLISADARISRPKGQAAHKVDGLDTVIKADQLRRTIEKHDDTMFGPAAIVSLAKVVRPDTIERVARELVALHRPITIDFAAKFGLSHEPGATHAISGPAIAPEARAGPEVMDEGTVTSPTCAVCGRSVSKGVVDFCAAYPNRFGGRTLCISCQRQPRDVATA
jgi:Nuclease-related domain